MTDALESDASVLVVDDDADIRLTLKELLEDEGYTVALANNGIEALERLRLLKPRLILLDLTMPVMSGVEFRQEQLRSGALADIPTVVMTADGRARETVASLRVADCLLKPLDLQQLFGVVRRYCR